MGLLNSSRWVSAADAFHKSIEAELPVPQYLIIGSGIPTLDRLYIWSDLSQTPRKWSARMGNGDGTVPLGSAIAVNGSEFNLNGVKHADLPNNTTTHELLQKILRDDLAELPVGVDLKPHNPPTTIEWFSGSPIRVTISDSTGRMTGLSADGSSMTEIPLIGPKLSIDILKAIINSLPMSQGTRTSLVAKVDAAGSAISRQDSVASKNILSALLQEIRAQSGKHLTTEQAEGLTVIVQQILATL
jgi:hypothetical protein